MSYSTELRRIAPLGVGTIVSECFSLLLRHFGSVAILAFVPTLMGLSITGVLIGWDKALGLAQPAIVNVRLVIEFALSIIVQLVTYGMTTALLVQLAYDAKLQRPLRLRLYIGLALRTALPIAVLSFFSGLLVWFGILMLVVPGLWIFAALSMMPAVVVIENAAFRGLGRSAALTKGYRWPVLGALGSVAVVTGIIGFITPVVTNLTIEAIGVNQTSIVLILLATSALSAIGFGLSSITTALTYARLREIKEGVSVSDIADVFD